MYSITMHPPGNIYVCLIQSYKSRRVRALGLTGATPRAVTGATPRAVTTDYWSTLSGSMQSRRGFAF